MTLMKLRTVLNHMQKLQPAPKQTATLKKSLRLYVTGTYFREAHVRAYVQRLESEGFSITHDWTSEDNNQQSPQMDLRTLAERTVRGIRLCDALVAIRDEPCSYGDVMVDIGSAVALGKPALLFSSWGPVTSRSSKIEHHSLVEQFKNFDHLVERLHELC